MFSNTPVSKHQLFVSVLLQKTVSSGSFFSTTKPCLSLPPFPSIPPQDVEVTNAFFRQQEGQKSLTVANWNAASCSVKEKALYQHLCVALCTRVYQSSASSLSRIRSKVLLLQGWIKGELAKALETCRVGLDLCHRSLLLTVAHRSSHTNLSQGEDSSEEGQPRQTLPGFCYQYFLVNVIVDGRGSGFYLPLFPSMCCRSCAVQTKCLCQPAWLPGSLATRRH